MLKTSHFHPHPPLFLDFWDCVALGHFSLCVRSGVVFNYCFRARARRFYLGFSWAHSLALGRTLRWIQLGRRCRQWRVCLTAWPWLWAPSSNVECSGPSPWSGSGEKTPPVFDSREHWIFLPPLDSLGMLFQVPCREESQHGVRTWCSPWMLCLSSVLS